MLNYYCCIVIVYLCIVQFLLYGSFFFFRLSFSIIYPIFFFVGFTLSREKKMVFMCMHIIQNRRALVWADCIGGFAYVCVCTTNCTLVLLSVTVSCSDERKKKKYIGEGYYLLITHITLYTNTNFGDFVKNLTLLTGSFLLDFRIISEIHILLRLFVTCLSTVTSKWIS